MLTAPTNSSVVAARRPNAMLSVMVPKKEFMKYVDYLKTCGYEVTEDHRGGMMQTIDWRAVDAEGNINVNFAGTSIMDAERGRRVYMLQIRA